MPHSGTPYNCRPGLFLAQLQSGHEFVPDVATQELAAEVGLIDERGGAGNAALG